jgi:hypothetical protein
MSYDRQSLRCSFLFTVAGTDEVADTGFHLTDPTSTSFDAASVLGLWSGADLTALAELYVDLMNASGAIMGWATYSHLSGVKLAAVDTGGHYLTEPLTQAVTGAQGGAHQVIPQSTQVLTLHSGQHFGRANHGRMYLPHTQPVLATDTPEVDNTNQHNMAVAAQTFVRAVNTLAASRHAGTRVSNLSRLGTGTTKVVAFVGIGKVVDTQRRRRNRLTESIEYLAA